MVLESLTDSERINIKDLVLEEPLKQPGFFSPEKDLSANDWERMKETLEYFREGFPADMFNFLPLAKSMKLLFPEREEELKVNTGIWQKSASLLESFIVAEKESEDNAIALRALIRCLSQVKVIFPPVSAIKKISKDYWEKGLNLLNDVLLNDDLFVYLDHASDMVILFSDQPDIREHLKLNENTLEKIINNTSEYEKADQVNWYGYAFSKGRTRLLFSQYRPHMTDRVWGDMISTVGEFKRKNTATAWLEFGAMAANMKILAAEEVRVTDQGIDIIMPHPQKSFQQPVPALPVRRRF